MKYKFISMRFFKDGLWPMIFILLAVSIFSIIFSKKYPEIIKNNSKTIDEKSWRVLHLGKRAALFSIAASVSWATVVLAYMFFLVLIFWVER